MNFKTRFNLLKTEKDVSLEQIALAVNYNTTSLSKVVNNKIKLTYELLKDLSDYFDVSIAYLIGQSNNRYNEKDIDEAYFDVIYRAKKMNLSPKFMSDFLDLIGRVPNNHEDR